MSVKGAVRLLLALQTDLGLHQQQLLSTEEIIPLKPADKHVCGENISACLL